jgi:hypothetical protein
MQQSTLVQLDNLLYPIRSTPLQNKNFFITHGDELPFNPSTGLLIPSNSAEDKSFVFGIFRRPCSKILFWILTETFPKDIGLKDAIAEALKMEETMLRFCQTAAEKSKHLMADVPRAFSLVAKKRSERIPKLKALLDQPK